VDWISSVKTWFRSMLSNSMLLTFRVYVMQTDISSLYQLESLCKCRLLSQVFKRTLFVAPQISVSLILGTAFMEEHVQPLLPRERLMVLSSGVSSTTGGRYSPFYFHCQVGSVVRYPSKDKDGCYSQGRSRNSILAEASLSQGTTVVRVQWCFMLTRSW
jgi:hypothetical protein